MQHLYVVQVVKKMVGKHEHVLLYKQQLQLLNWYCAGQKWNHSH